MESVAQTGSVQRQEALEFDGNALAERREAKGLSRAALAEAAHEGAFAAWRATSSIAQSPTRRARRNSATLWRT